MSNVRDFGAKGDGVTLDTSAIQRAIASGAHLIVAAERHPDYGMVMRDVHGTRLTNCFFGRKSIVNGKEL